MKLVPASSHWLGGRVQSRRMLFTVVLAISALLSSCGGGGGGSSGATSAPSTASPTALSYPSPQTLIVGTAMTALVPSVSGTVTSYAVAPSLPAGLSIDASTGRITGTPTTVGNSTSTITALGSSGSATFQLSFNIQPPAPSALAYSSPQNLFVGSAMAPALPTVTGTVTGYSVAPSLPAGLALDAATGRITGTPTAVSSATVTITAANGTGATTFQLSFNIQPPGPPSGLSYPNPGIYTVGQAIAPLNPTVTGVVTSYTVSPALPAGLTLNSATGQITGAPTVTNLGIDHTIRASNAAGSAQTIVRIVVALPTSALGFSYPSPVVYDVGETIVPISPTVIGNTSSFYYYVFPALPPGLQLDSASGQIAGTPTTAVPAASYNIVLSNGQVASNFSLSIATRFAAPGSLSYRSPAVFTAGVPIAALRPSMNGFATSFTVSPALPTGLTLDPVLGRISGTPTVATSAANYVVTASNPAGATSFSLSVQVNLIAPWALSYAGPARIAAGMAMTPLDPFVGGVVSSYSVSPALPTGLTLNSTTGRISGTPAAISAATNYLVTATNGAGSTSYTLSLAVDAVGVSPARISRHVAVGTPVTIALNLSSVTLPASGAIYSTAASPANLFNGAVAVTPVAGGYVLYAMLSTSAPAGHYVGNLTLSLCGNAACTVPLTPASVVVPYDLQVLAANSTWPGNNLSALAPWTTAPDWAMYQGNAAHTGHVPADVDVNRFTTRWQSPTRSVTSLDGISPLATSAGKVFVTNSTGALAALDENDAATIWQLTGPSPGLRFWARSAPAVADGTVFLTGDTSVSFVDRRLYAFDASSGAFTFNAQVPTSYSFLQAPTVGPRGVYFHTGDGLTNSDANLLGVTFSGRQLFKHLLKSILGGFPAAETDRVYAFNRATNSMALQVLNSVSGAVEATIADSTLNSCYATPILGSTDSVFGVCSVATGHINLFRFNTATRSVAWSIGNGGGSFGSGIAYRAGVIYCTRSDPQRLEARDEATGALLWAWSLPIAGEFVASDVLLTNSTVFVSTTANTYGVDVTTGKLVWSYPRSGALALSQNGILYIQGINQLTAINVR